MGLKVDRNGGAYVACDSRQDSTCQAATASCWGEETAKRAAETRGWRYSFLTGKWSCPVCWRIENFGFVKLRFFRTKKELIQSVPAVFRDLLSGRTIKVENGTLVIAKTGLDPKILNEVRSRFQNWGFQLQENEKDLYATPIGK